MMGKMKAMLMELQEAPLMVRCEDCDGEGYSYFEIIRPQSFSRDIGYLEEVREVCETCGGDGEVEQLCDCGMLVTKNMGQDAKQCEECAL
jgi:DnaJ-class molecular chaperone